MGALLVAGCSGSATSAPTSAAPPSTAWAHEAQEWLAAFDAASAFGRDPTASYVPGPNLQAPYYAAEVVVESADFAGFTAVGRWNALASARSFAGDADRLEMGATYLDVDGVVRPSTYVSKDGGAIGFLTETSIGPNGITRVLQMGSESLAPADSANPYRSAAQAAAERIAAAYLKGWSGTDPTALADIYASNVTVVDSLHRLAVAGLPAVTALAAQTPLTLAVDRMGEDYPAVALDETADPGVSSRPAVFIRQEPPRYGDLRELTILAHSTADCPGALAIDLLVNSAGKVTAEQRYHLIDSERACTAPSDLAVGWWTGRALPTPLDERVTGHIDTAAGVVEIRDGTPTLDATASSAIQRFARAGLGVPSITSITFNPYDEACTSQDGTITWSGSSIALLVCTDGSEILEVDPVCRSDPGATCITSAADIRHALMHEIAHAWLAANATDQVRAAFLRAVGLSTWDDAATPWDKRGFEWAAETLTWALEREPATPERLGSPSCATLVAGYLALTGRTAPVQCP